MKHATVFLIRVNPCNPWQFFLIQAPYVYLFEPRFLRIQHLLSEACLHPQHVGETISHPL